MAEDTARAQVWVHIQRGDGRTDAFGPYPNEEAAYRALTDSPLIDAECEQDCIDAWTEPGTPGPTVSRVTIDLADPDHTGPRP